MQTPYIKSIYIQILPNDEFLTENNSNDFLQSI